MGKQIHILSNKDELAKTADCANCGAVRIVHKGTWRCVIAVREHKHTYKTRGRPATCDVCGSGKRICYDHNHKTGSFRGWLCHNCNVALGMALDDPIILRKLAAYLEK